MIRQLPAGFALVIRGGCAPVIARLPRAWKNPAYRRARRLGPAPAGTPPRPPSTRPSETPNPTSPTTCPPTGSPATAPPTPGADHDPTTRSPPRCSSSPTTRAAHSARRPRSRPLHRAHRAAHRAHRPDHRHRPHARGRRTALARLEALDRQVTDLAAQLTGPTPIRRLPPRPGPGMVEARGRRPPGTHRPAAGLGRAGLPARLRAPGRHPRPLLALPRPVPVRPGHPVRPVVGPVPPARAPPGCCPPRPNTRPASCPPWPPS